MMEDTAAAADHRRAVPSRTDRRWPLLVEAIEQLAAARSVDGVVVILRNTARRVVGSDGIAVVLREDGFCRYVAEDAVGPLWTGQRFPAESCVSGWSMSRGQTAVIPDVFADVRVPHEAYRRTFVKSMAMVPIGRPTPTAALGAYWADAREPSDEELSAIEALGRAAATALENIRLVDALAQSEARLRAVFETRAVGLALYRPAERGVPLVNDRMLELAGLTRDELETGRRGFDKASAPDCRAGDEAARQSLLRGDGVAPYPKAFVHPDGSRRHVLIAAERLAEPDLTVVTAQDLSAVRAAEEGLRESEERFRLIAETIREVFYVFDLGGPRLDYVSPAYEELWGRSRESLHDAPLSFLDGVHPDDQPAVKDAMRRQLAGERTDVEYRIVRPDGTVRWMWDRAYPLGSGSPNRVVGVAEDISDRREAEERMGRLAAELDHRTKNMLSVVRSLVHLTLRDPRVPDDVRAALDGRLDAFGTAHALLGRVRWAPATLADIVGAALAPHGDRVAVQGPPVELAPKGAVAMSLALHELATNAVKYGALGAAEGRVDALWSVTDLDGERRLYFVWRETGGPPVPPPERRGFGTRMIERSLAADLGGDASIAFEPTGLVAELRARLD